jgi:hypothetical protein
MTHQCCTLEVESRAMEAKQTVLLICLFRLTPIMELTPVCIHLLLQYCFVSEYTDALKQKTRCFTVTAISTYFLLTSSWCYPHHHDCSGVSLCTAQISQIILGHRGDSRGSSTPSGVLRGHCCCQGAFVTLSQREPSTPTMQALLRQRSLIFSQEKRRE